MPASRHSQLSEFYSTSQVSHALSGLSSAQSIAMANANVSLVHNYLSAAQAQTLLNSLLTSLDWQQPRLKMFGREVLSPRLHAWHGDADAQYRWSGRVWQPKPWPASLATLRDELEQKLGVRFNSCLVNRYRNGEDAMGWHADDERELGKNPVIASISIGAVREFDFQHRGRGDLNGTPAKHRIPLASGSLLLMFGSTQHHWKHRIRRQRAVTGERLNLTFRVVRNH